MTTLHLRVRRPPKYSKGKPNVNGFSPRGRKESSLTRQVKRLMFEAIRIGMPPVRAAELAGVEKRKFNEWMNKGKDPKNKDFHKFRIRVMSIVKSRELSALEIIHKCGKGGYRVTKTKIKTYGEGKNKQVDIERTTETARPQWQAEAWYLERVYKEHYGRDAVVDDSTPDEKAKQINDLVQAMNASVEG